MCLYCSRSMKATGVVLAGLLFGAGWAIIDAIKNRRKFMQTASSQSDDENTIEQRVIIQRPVQSVYEFYRDFHNLPTFLGDVMKIEQTGPATSRWTIQGPLRIQAH